VRFQVLKIKKVGGVNEFRLYDIIYVAYRCCEGGAFGVVLYLDDYVYGFTIDDCDLEIHDFLDNEMRFLTLKQI